LTQGKFQRHRSSIGLRNMRERMKPGFLENLCERRKVQAWRSTPLAPDAEPDTFSTRNHSDHSRSMTIAFVRDGVRMRLGYHDIQGRRRKLAAWTGAMQLATDLGETLAPRHVPTDISMQVPASNSRQCSGHFQALRCWCCRCTTTSNTSSAPSAGQRQGMCSKDAPAQELVSDPEAYVGGKPFFRANCSFYGELSWALTTR
jgi:hypothetical protein